MNPSSVETPGQEGAEKHNRLRCGGWTWRSLLSKLQFKILAAFLTVSLVPLAILAVYNYGTTERALTNLANQSLFSAASQTSWRLDDFITGNLTTARTAAGLPGLTEYLALIAEDKSDSDKETRALQALSALCQRNTLPIASCAILDLKGRNVADTAVSGVGQDEAGQDYFRVAIETGVPYVSYVQFSPEGREAVLYFSSPVHHPVTGKSTGVLRFRYNAAVLQKLTAEDSATLAPGAFAVLVNENGVILADTLSPPGNPSSLSYKVFTPLDPARAAQLRAARRLPEGDPAALLVNVPGLAKGLERVGTAEPYFEAERINGTAQPYSAAVVRMKARPWRIAFFVPQESLQAPVLSQVRTTIILAVIIALTVATAAAIAARFLTAPIADLTAMAQEISKGNFEVQADARAQDEIGVLAAAFNTMTGLLRGLIASLEQRVTELRETGEALRESEQRYRLLFENSSVAIREEDYSAVKSFLNDLEREGCTDIEHYLIQHPDDLRRCAGLVKVVDVNPATLTLHEAANKDELLNGIDQLFTTETYEHFLRVIIRLWEGKTEFTEDTTLKTLAGGLRYITIYFSVCPGYEDTASKILVSMVDVTGRRKAEAELRRYKDHLEETVQQRTSELLLARDAAEAANKAKSVFLANMSHELRTPLNAILGFSALLRLDSGLNAKQQENIDIINRSGSHLLKLIDDVLEIAKIEAGRVQLAKAPFDLGAMVQDVAEMMRARAAEKGLQIAIDQSSAFPRYINGDEARLRQILVNLAGNAVKFTDRGTVTIRLGTTLNGGRKLAIEVEDTGPGISEEDQKRLFKPFAQLGETGTQKGTGLGLAISRQFAELMGGAISVTSTVGKGSLFRIEIPAETAGAEEVASRQSVASAGEVAGLAPGTPPLRILIVEDQLENQLLLQTLMNRIGVDVKVAANGLEGLKLFEEWRPHLIWMDRRMPVMDGLEATRRIRSLPGGAEVKIVAVTASVFKEQQQAMLDAGMDDVVRKPYRSEEIYTCLEKHLGVRYTYQIAAFDPAPAAAGLTPEMLDVLNTRLRDDLREALQSLDAGRIGTVLQQVSATDAGLGRTLSRLAEDFNYPAILQALASAGK